MVDYKFFMKSDKITGDWELRVVVLLTDTM